MKRHTLFLLFIFFYTSAFPQNIKSKQTASVSYIDPVADYKYIDANNILMWVSNNGDGSHDPNTDGLGLFWNTGNSNFVPLTFEDGLLYGYKLETASDTTIYVNGNTHRQGLIPGLITLDGLPDDPAKEEYRVYKYDKNWETLTDSIEKSERKKDILTWPIAQGAPFLDKNRNGKYEPFVDEPGNGADQFLFYVANGADAARSTFTFGSYPYPVEFHVSVWAYNRGGGINDVVFKKYEIINKGSQTMKEMYLGYWVDDDAYYAGDDYIGCDTSLNMAYTYNSNDTSYHIPHPAIGRMILQGPIVDGNENDKGYFQNNWHTGRKNIGMTAFQFPYFPVVFLGTSETAIEVYRYLRGLKWNGSPVVNPKNNDTTKFILDGDPVTKTGWYEGDGTVWYIPNSNYYYNIVDRKYLLSSGPFNLAPGDTQEIVYAFFAGRRINHIQSITELRQLAKIAKSAYYVGVQELPEEQEPEPELPHYFSLKSNYPNPFNPTTTIKFVVSAPPDAPPFGGTNLDKWFISLKVYDILGREVATLVNEKLAGGEYTVEFNGGNLPSGVYFYTLSGGGYSTTKKMVVLK